MGEYVYVVDKNGNKKKIQKQDLSQYLKMGWVEEKTNPILESFKTFSKI